MEICTIIWLTPRLVFSPLYYSKTLGTQQVFSRYLLNKRKLYHSHVS